MESKIIASIIIFILGLIFFFNNKNIGRGSYKFYKWLYTEKNLVIIFRIVGIVLIIGSLLMMFVD